MNLQAYIPAVPTFGENVRRIRKLRKMTQEDLQKRLGYERQGTVSTLETSQTVPSPKRIIQIAQGLDCTTAELMTGVITAYDLLRDNVRIEKRAATSRERRGPPDANPRPGKPKRTASAS